MSFKLREITFHVRCTEPGCVFSSEFTVRENIMGATEADVDAEAWKIAKNMAYIRHDSIHGRKHPLANPELHKISGRYDRLGPAVGGAHAAPAPVPSPAGASAVRHYKKGEKIIRKGESAVTVCEVIRGSACNVKRPELFYQPGTTFGAAALFEHKSRLADIVAGQDDTVIGFYNMRDLSRTNPAKARELYNSAMEDIFDILTYLEGYCASLEKQVTKLKSVKPAQSPARKAAPKGKASLARKQKTPKKPAVGKKPARPTAKRKPAARRGAAGRR